MTKVSPAYLCVTQLLKICGTFYLIPFNNEWCIMGNWFQNSWEDSDTEELQNQFMQVKGDNVYFYRSCHYHYVNKDATNYLARLYINIYLSLLTKYKHVFTFNK
jgi:hypothetical protein